MPQRRSTVATLLAAVTLPLLVASCAAIDDGDGRRRGGGIFDQGGVFGGGGGGGGLFGGGGQTVAFRCDDDRRFDVSFRDRGDEVVVRTRNGNYRLELEGRDGRRRQYGDDDVVLYVDGDEARLRIKDEPDYKDCEGRRSGFF